MAEVYLYLQTICSCTKPFIVYKIILTDINGLASKWLVDHKLTLNAKYLLIFQGYCKGLVSYPVCHQSPLITRSALDTLKSYCYLCVRNQSPRSIQTHGMEVSYEDCLEQLHLTTRKILEFLLLDKVLNVLIHFPNSPLHSFTTSYESRSHSQTFYNIIMSHLQGQIHSKTPFFCQILE